MPRMTQYPTLKAENLKNSPKKTLIHYILVLVTKDHLKNLSETSKED
jgi:hypothetical protein